MHLSLSVLSLALAASSSVALSFDNAPHPALDKPSNAMKPRQIGRDSRDRAGPARLDNGRMDHSGNLAAGDQLRQLLESLGNNGRLAINDNGNGNGNGRNGAMDHDGTARVIIIAQGNEEHDQQRGDGRGRGGLRGNNDDGRDRGRGRGGREDGPGRNRGGNGRDRNKGKDNLGAGAGGDASAIAPPSPPPPALGTDASAIIDASAIVDASAVDPPARPTAVPFRPTGAPAPPAAINGTDASAIIDASATAIDPAAAAGKPAPPTALPGAAAVAGEKKGKVQAKVRHGVESRRRGKRNTPPHA